MSGEKGGRTANALDDSGEHIEDDLGGLCSCSIVISGVRMFT